MGIPALLKTRRFLPLFITQFLGAFNDNVFKNALVMLITYRLAAKEGVDAPMLVTVAAGLFILPFLLFSATAGQLADKIDRAAIARMVKLAEIGLMVMASIGFYWENIYVLLFVLFLAGTHSTFFGPIKYALLPQHLHEAELIAGNAYIEAATFLAILLGTILGGLLVLSDFGSHLISAGIVLYALLGYAASRYIPPAPAPEPGLRLNWNIAQETWRIIAHDRARPRVFLAILGISWFWLVGAVFLSQFPAFTRITLHADETVVTLLLAVFSIGIGIGSGLCSWLLKGRIITTYIPWAGLGISIFALDMYLASSGASHTGDALSGATEFVHYWGNVRILADLLGIALCGGLYAVPLYALMQHESDPLRRARTIASNNVMNALFMVASSLACVWMLGAGYAVADIFLATAVANVPAALYMRKLSAKS